MPVLVPSARVARWRPCAYVLGVLWLLVPLLVYADQFTGKVVGILDGDTISVLREGKVTTGPEAGATTNRDTSVVVRELFAHAERSVLVAGYAVYEGQRVFQALADRMHQRPELAVRLFLDVRRTAGDTSRATDVVHRFGERFRRYEWPQGCPLPQVFYLPLSLEEAPEKRAALHAKCVVVDRHIVFVSSANFTEAAHKRNIEVGLLIQAGWLAERITGHFDAMVTERLLVPVYR